MKFTSIKLMLFPLTYTYERHSLQSSWESMHFFLFLFFSSSSSFEFFFLSNRKLFNRKDNLLLVDIKKRKLCLVLLLLLRWIIRADFVLVRVLPTDHRRFSDDNADEQVALIERDCHKRSFFSSPRFICLVQCERFLYWLDHLLRSFGKLPNGNDLKLKWKLVNVWKNDTFFLYQIRGLQKQFLYSSEIYVWKQKIKLTKIIYKLKNLMSGHRELSQIFCWFDIFIFHFINTFNKFRFFIIISWFTPIG